MRLLLSAVLACMLIACGHDEKEVMAAYPDGKPKREVTYSGDGGHRHMSGEIQYYENGHKKLEGKYGENGTREGKWMYWYESGKTWSECSYSGGLKQGETRVYYPSGTLRYTGSYAGDAQTGHWTFYDEQGNVLVEQDY